MAVREGDSLPSPITTQGASERGRTPVRVGGSVNGGGVRILLGVFGELGGIVKDDVGVGRLFLIIGGIAKALVVFVELDSDGMAERGRVVGVGWWHGQDGLRGEVEGIEVVVRSGSMDDRVMIRGV